MKHMFFKCRVKYPCLLLSTNIKKKIYLKACPFILLTSFYFCITIYFLKYFLFKNILLIFLDIFK